MPNRIVFIMVLWCMPLSLLAQHPDFKAAEKFDAPNLEKQLGSTSFVPFFLKDGHRFWFTTERLPNAAGSGNKLHKIKDYFLVDPQKKKKINLFNQTVILKQLRELVKGNVDSLEINYMPDFSPDERAVKVTYAGVNYWYDFERQLLYKPAAQKAPSFINYQVGDQSPDKKWIIYARNHNLYLKKNGTDQETKLSADGAEDYSFSMNPSDKYAADNSGTDVVWTHDSQHFYLLRKDSRKINTLTVINSLGSPRPYVNTFKYELPGDSDVVQYELFTGSIIQQSLTKVNTQRWKDQELSLVKAADCDDKLYFIRRKRSRDQMELCSVNFNSGEVRTVIHEVSKPFINEDLFSVSIVNKGNDILWWSDRSGWGQYYHYNSDGLLLNSIGHGNWTAGNVIGIDTTRGTFYFYGYGKEAGRNPNYAFVYAGDFAGKKQLLLTPEDANHGVFLSTDKKYLIDTYSRIDLEPVSVLRTTAGSFAMEVFKPDFTALYKYGWKKPETFRVRAADGKTDLYGIMWKPFNFDPTKKYPVISQVYPGPFTETVWNDFTVFDRYNNTSLAQVGFIVVVMGHRGSSPYRNAAYYKYGYGNLRDYALADDKTGLEQLATKYSFIDLNRVGIFGHSGGGMMATAAICTYPDFYKVAVSSSGNHDNRLFHRAWGESYQGFDKPVALNQNLAKNLKGHLLLVSGESDENVNPSNTYRMVDALIRENKDFDMLILPGQNHTYDDEYKHYFQQRLRAYFAKYLLIDNK